ncbi:MAG TPA: ATP-binding cassette domain-containing protein, partial [Gallionellaceae bacterium]|nr:ATP-binding cassette domain-containing protein [Gallionellaceae bacterium]
MNTAATPTASSPHASDPAQPALIVRQLHKAFHLGKREIRALHDISFQVRHGVITGLVGPDAAGKTTLMRLAAGLLAPDAGSITILGHDATQQSLEVQAAIGYMPQRFGLYEDLTVQENLDLYSNLQGVPQAQRAARHQELMHMAGLAPFTRRLAGKLSGGMKQKLGLACALIRQPQLLLLDEPTVGVDPLSRRELWAIVNRLVHEQGTSVLLSTAYLDEAERCDEVVLLHEGRLLAQGTPDTLREPMRGRTWQLAASGLEKRAAQSALAQAPSVLDSLIQGEHIRLVMQEGAAASADALLPGTAGITLSAVPPRFEDSFVALLLSQSGAEKLHHPAAPAATAHERTNTDNAVIEVHDLQCRFGDFYAVKNISFTVRKGEVFGLLGANGAGKSTTFRMLCGLLPPSGGTLRVAGADLRHAAAAARARIGYMSQKFSLYGNLSVVENLRFFSSIYGVSAKEAGSRIRWALHEFELAPMADFVSGDLSLGYKQRLALACALMHEPQILFLDEPTSGVDPLARREFWARINTLAQQGVT